MRRPAATLLLLACLTFLLGLGRQAITDTDEAFYAEASREMVEGGDWLTPHFNYVDRWQKPVLYYWATAATFVTTGTSEWGARLWSALSGLALVWLTWIIGRRLLGDDAGWIGAAIVATGYGYFAIARLALPDLPLALFVTLGTWAWLDRRYALAGLAAALGFLDKGPLALVLPGLVLLPLAWWEARLLRRGDPRVDDASVVRVPVRALLVAGVVFVVVGLPWYAAMIATHGRPYIDSFFIGDNLERFATDRFNSPRSFAFYLPILLGGVFPWTVFLVVLPWRRLREVVSHGAAWTQAEWRLLAWALLPLLFFSASVGKQPRYILPVLPPLALLLGQAIATRIREASASTDRRAPALAASTWVTAVLFALLAVLLWRARPILINALPLLHGLSVVALAITAVGLAAVARARAWTRLPMALAVSGVVVLLAAQFGALSGSRPEAVETLAAMVREARTGTERIGTYQLFVRNLVFYTGQPQVELPGEAAALDFLRSTDRVLFVVRDRDLPRLELISGVTTRKLGEVRYLDPATLKLSTLISPLPDQDITRVLLVSNR